MGISRRHFLKTVGGSIACATLAGVTLPGSVIAKGGDDHALSDNVNAAVKAKYGALPIEKSDRIQIKAPEIAENGAFVPVSVSTDLPGVTSISIYADANFTPIVASFDILPKTRPDVSLRIRMAKTSNMDVIVKAGDKLYRASREVKVTIGGCGG